MRPRDLLTDALLGRLQGGDGADADALARDIARLREAGYLSVTLPPELGGLGCTLRQAACGQRRLAGVAPRTALAVSAHLYWTGAAADACRSGDPSVKWILLEAARGALFGGGHGEPGNDLKLAAPDSRCDPDGDSGYRFRDPATALASMTPHWDWLAVHALAQAAVSRGGEQSILPYPPVVPRPPGRARLRRARGAMYPRLPGGPGAAARRPVRRVHRERDRLGVLGAGERRVRRRPAGVPAGRRRRRGPRRRMLRPAAGALRPLRPPGAGPLARRRGQLAAGRAQVAHRRGDPPLAAGPRAGPDLGGQQLIAIFAMRREVAEGAGRVRALSAAITSAAGAAPAPRAGGVSARPAV